MIATLERKVDTATQPAKVQAALEFLIENGVFNEDQSIEALRFMCLYEDGIDPADEFEAFKLCRKHYRTLEKHGINLPKQAEWESAYKLQDMQVWNLTKRSGPYSLSWNNGFLECSCDAFQKWRSECGHVRYAYTQLTPPQAEEPTPIPAVTVEESHTPEMTNHEILPGIFATVSQWKALKEMIAFANGERGFTYLLTGKAGTGKSALVQALVHHLQSQGCEKKVAFTALSNKAVDILRGMVSQWDLGIETFTCAVLLGLKPSTEGSEITFERDPAEKCLAENYDLVVVDECSQIPADMWEFLMSEVTLKTRFLFMGDPFQAPPINEKLSNSFMEVADQSNLTGIMRYGGAIAEIAESLRQNPARREAPEITTGDGVFKCDRQTWNGLLVKAFRSDSYAQDRNSARAVAYTNDRVGKINAMVRGALFPGAAQFVEGERLVARNHYSMPDLTGNDVKIFSTADEMVVTRAVEGKAGDWKVWYLTVQNYNSQAQPQTVPVIHQDSLKDYAAALKSISDSKRWVSYWALRNRFADVAYAYCLTAHMAQGSTFKNVFVDVPNFMRNRTANMIKFPGCDREQPVLERNMLLYVAMTRGARLFVPE
jgi:exodeoxyribonuclease-5